MIQYTIYITYIIQYTNIYRYYIKYNILYSIINYKVYQISYYITYHILYILHSIRNVFIDLMIHRYNLILHICQFVFNFISLLASMLCIQGGCFLHRDGNKIGQSLATQQVVQFEGLNWGFKDVFRSVLVCWCQFSHCFAESSMWLARSHDAVWNI